MQQVQIKKIHNCLLESFFLNARNEFIKLKNQISLV